MSQTIQTGQTSVSGTVTAAIASLTPTIPVTVGTGQTQIVGCSAISMTQNTAVTIYTPTAGYDFYVTDISVEGLADGSLVRFGDNISGAARTTDASRCFGWVYSAAGTSKIHLNTPLQVSTALKLSQSGTTQTGLVSYAGVEVPQ